MREGDNGQQYMLATKDYVDEERWAVQGIQSGRRKQ